MAFSLFSNKNSTDQKKTSEGTVISPVVQTMREDLEYLKNYNEGKRVPSGKSKEETKKTYPQKSAETVSVKSAINPFSKEGEKAFQEGMNITSKKADAPAWAVPPLKAVAPGKPLEQKDARKDSLSTSLKALPRSQPPQEKGNRLLIISIVVVTLCLIFLGVYYYFFVVKKNVTPMVTPEQMVEPVPSESVVVPLNESIYALDKPNYLSVNTEVISPEEIQKTLSLVASRIKEAGISQPVEFLITDQNNTPVAFSRFATLLKIALPQELLSRINESFSLSLYNDAGFMRVGLNLIIDDQIIFLPTLSKIEGTLPFLFQTLMLEPGIVVPETIIFKSNTYASSSLPEQKNPLRYANIDIPKKVSIDYAVVANHWYIGTSRNTLIVLLDRITK